MERREDDGPEVAGGCGLVERREDDGPEVAGGCGLVAVEKKPWKKMERIKIIRKTKFKNNFPV